jgi:hypothetical protein
MPSTGRRLARRFLPAPFRRGALRLTGDRLSERAVTPRRRSPAGDTRGSRATAGAPVPLVDVLRHGGDLTAAVLAQVRGHLDAHETQVAQAIATSLRRRAATSELGDLAAGVVAFRRGYVPLAWALLEPLPVHLWAVHAPAEYARSGLMSDPDETIARVTALVEDRDVPVPPSSWLEVLGPVFGHGAPELAQRLFERLDEAVGHGDQVVGAGTMTAEDLVVNRDWLRNWVDARPDDRSAEAPEGGAVPFAVMDYGHPGRSRASANIGDHVQSIASLGHVVRHQDLTFHGPQDLVDLVHQLRARVRPERHLSGGHGDVQLVSLDRDASSYSAIPPNTWTLAFGWFMHPIFEMRYDFPFHPNLLPIFVSFHCSKRELLTDEAIDYLRRFAPIGCRDWTTVDVLLSVGVPAFFSGCMTTTVSTVFPDTADKPAPDAPVAYVDVPADLVPPGAPTYQHSDDTIRFRSFAANMYDAIDLLERYRHEHSGLVTSRLHCYLPGRSLGVPVDFQPANRSDPRFAGLIDITDEEFDRMREGILAKLEVVLTEVFRGTSPDKVYALWRDVAGPEVEAARRRHAAPSLMPAAKTDLVADAISLRSQASPPPGSSDVAREDDGDTIDVVVHAPRGRSRQLKVLFSTLARAASRPVRVTVLTRAPALDERDLRRSVPGLDVRVLRTTGLCTALRRLDGSKPAPRDIDLLALPHLLEDVDRAVVLPVDSVALGDVAELADLDLGGGLAAAPTVVGSRGTSGFGLLHSAAGRLGARTAASTELRRQAHARHVFDFDAFESDVLVLDLAEMRRRSIVETYVPYVEEFSLTYREILLLEVGPARAVVPERWHVVPGRSAVTDPALVHWADPGKPWSDDAVPEQELWLEAESGLRAG